MARAISEPVDKSLSIIMPLMRAGFHTRWIFFQKENHHVRINAPRTKRAATLQRSPARVPDLSQTRERFRRRHDCQPQTFAKTLSSLASRAVRTTVRSVAGGDYQVL